MKILHLIDERWDSGLTAYALQIARLLQEGGDDVTLGVLPGKPAERAARSLGMRVAPFGSLADRWRLLRERWDVVNAHTGTSHTWSVLFGRWRSDGPRPVLVRTRGDARELRTDPLIRWIYRRTDGVIAASGHIGKMYRDELGRAESSIRIVYPGIDAGGPPAPPEPETVGVVGRLDEVKGHATFLEAAARVLASRPRVRFLIAGKEAGVTQALLRNQAQALGVASSVEFLGHVPSARSFMERCAIGVIASIGSEEISRACLEWMAVGRPVVATIVGCLPELIDAEENGLLVAPKDGEALGAAIVRTLSDPAAAERWGRESRERIERLYAPARMRDATRSFYQELLNTRRP